MPIRDVVSHAALGVNVSDSAPGDTPIVRVSDLPSDVAYLLNDDQFERRSLNASRARESATIEPDDVILVARGGQLRVGIANPGMGGAVIANNLMLLRTRPTVLQGPVLAAWLGSPRGQHELAKISRSSTSMMSLRTADVLDLEVPVPPMDVQEHITSLLFESAHAYMAAVAAAELRERLVRARCAELLQGVSA